MDRRTVLRLTGQGVSVSLAAAALALVDRPAIAACPRLGGTFLQLTDVQTAWSPHEWRKLFDELRAIGIRDLFVQWTVIDRTAFVDARGLTTPANNPLPAILNLASEHGIGVWLGLELDTQYWGAIKHTSPLLKIYFRERVNRLERFLGGLDAASRAARFAGWYITDEIDDKTWLPPERRAILEGYLADTTKLLRRHRPRSRVAISGFSNGFADPALLGSFWAGVLKAADISVLLFQDGIGEGKISPKDIGLYYRALNAALRQERRELGGVVELFSLTSSGRRVPGPIGRILRQIAIAEQFTSFPPVAFSVPDYMSDLAGPAARRLLSHFRAARRGCHG